MTAIERRTYVAIMTSLMSFFLEYRAKFISGSICHAKAFTRQNVQFNTSHRIIREMSGYQAKYSAAVAYNKYKENTPIKQQFSKVSHTNKYRVLKYSTLTVITCIPNNITRLMIVKRRKKT